MRLILILQIISLLILIDFLPVGLLPLGMNVANHVDWGVKNELSPVRNVYQTEIGKRFVAVSVHYQKNQFRFKLV